MGPRSAAQPRGAGGLRQGRHHGQQGSPLTTHEWLARVLARPLADPLDWDGYSLTMAEPTWSAVWAEIEAGQAYDDGLELGLRLLQATRQHRGKLTARVYASSQIRLYRSILSMLDKAGRWAAYLQAWDAILTRTDLCLNLKGDAAADNPALAAFVRRPDGGLGMGRPSYGAGRPVRVDVHFLHTLLGRKAVVVRRLAHEQHRSTSPPPNAPGPVALTDEEIQRRLVQAGEPVTPAAGCPADPGPAGDAGLAGPDLHGAAPSGAVNNTHSRRSREF